MINRSFRMTLLPAAVFAALGISASAQADSVRFATFNASLNRNSSGELLSDLSNPFASGGVSATVANRIQQVHNVAEIIQRVNADVLLVNEFDYDQNGVPSSSNTPSALGYSSQAALMFQDNFLDAGHGNATRGLTTGVNYAYRYTPTTNTGLASGFDLDNSGSVGGGNDAFGFGNFPGQYGMTIYSKYEINDVRTFQNFLWKDMPSNLLTDDPTVGANNLGTFYSAAEQDILRLSSKNHVDITLKINGQEVHMLAAHPTPPVFDGAEDRNGKRNHDEIRFFKDYIAGESYIYDDQGNTGGLVAGAKFIIAGDMNADPNDGDSFGSAIDQLLNSPLVNTGLTPDSAGGTAAANYPSNNGSANDSHVTHPRFDTADFNDAGPGNLRVDYVLPSANLAINSGEVFWPVDPQTGDTNNTGDVFDLVGTFRNQNLYANFPSSDHKLVWVDVEIAPIPEPEIYAMFMAGLGLMGFMSRRRKKAIA
ncbi:MAG: endonuclease/exonuclease/phosphatase family protein [Nitrosospira sp.]|nr:endonuclease/exonuclease/phosphatase family protein [Nitrosospira sp.]